MKLTKYLLVAEVDKIQSFVFRSSRLREVAGASRLLEKFAEDFYKYLKNDAQIPDDDILSSKGGSFRFFVTAANEEQLDPIKQALRQRFEREVGGTITITHVEYEANDTVIKEGNRALRRAKLTGDDPAPVWHSPYHAICASSGEELAVAFQKPVDTPNERKRYMGNITLKKAEIDAKVAISRELRDELAKVTGLNAIQVHEKATEVETYAQFDPRQYVAYLVADGNSMGKYFNSCTPEVLKKLSPKIGETTLNALATAIMQLVHYIPELPNVKGFDRDTLPILPLISGGDDLFVLMPAPWALDVARLYCKAYQKGMSAQLHNLGLLNEQEIATTGVAIVICKASYPYRTAHEYADALLRQAKSYAKDENVKQSCLIVDFVVGSDTVGSNDRIEPQGHTFEEAKYFVEQRFALRGLPSRILHQVEAALIHQQDTTAIVERVRQLYPRLEYADNLEKALSDSPRLRELLKLWDFCYDMNRQRDKYLTEER